MWKRIPLTERREGKADDVIKKPVATMSITILLGLCLCALIQIHFFPLQRNFDRSDRRMNSNHTNGNHSVQLFENSKHMNNSQLVQLLEYNNHTSGNQYAQVLENNDTLLHCWRTSTLGERAKYDILITGCGYSSTGFFSQTFTDAGYPVGHERLKKHGASFWQVAGRKHNHSPFKFRHIFLLVRHPLKVILSEYGTKWNFINKGVNVRKESIMENPKAFNKMKIEFKTLEWWVSYTLLAEHIAECYVRNEDISAELFLQMCQRAELPDCQHKNWSHIIQQKEGYNSHRTTKRIKKLSLTWQNLEKKVSTKNERIILDHARRVCKRYYDFEDC